MSMSSLRYQIEFVSDNFAHLLFKKQVNTYWQYAVFENHKKMSHFTTLRAKRATFTF